MSSDKHLTHLNRTDHQHPSLPPATTPTPSQLSLPTHSQLLSRGNRTPSLQVVYYQPQLDQSPVTNNDGHQTVNRTGAREHNSVPNAIVYLLSAHHRMAKYFLLVGLGANIRQVGGTGNNEHKDRQNFVTAFSNG